MGFSRNSVRHGLDGACRGCWLGCCSMPITRVPGLQSKRGKDLAAMVGRPSAEKADGITAPMPPTMGDVRRLLSRTALVERFGEVRM